MLQQYFISIFQHDCHLPKTQYSSRTQFYTFSTYVTVSVFKYGMTVTVALLDFVLLSKIRKRFAAHELSRRTAVL